MPRTAAARPDAIRRHNLALVLQQIHLDGALSRAQLTQRSGLSRSTIRGLVGELSELDLLRESVPVGGTRAGRPSHIVGPRPDGPYALAVDIDIDHVSIAAVGIGGQILGRHVARSSSSPVAAAFVVSEVAAAIPVLQQQVHSHARPVGIGISVPGTIDSRTGTIGLAPNLGWHDVALRRLLHVALPAGLPVSIGNDADLAVLAEHRRGGARGYDDVVYLLGRIGVGAGILVDGQPLRGAAGMAGEVGHTVLDPAGPDCHCGSRGCVETLIGDAALTRLAGRTERSAGAGAASVLRAAAAGKARELRAVQSLAEQLGRVVTNVVNLLNPQLVVMGGLLREVFVLAQDHVEAVLQRHALPGSRAAVELRPSAHSGDGPLLGAAELAFAELLADPLGTATTGNGLPNVGVGVSVGSSAPVGAGLQGSAIRSPK